MAYINPHWLNDDDSIREWLSNHSTVEVRNLPTAVKIRAINKLMDWWISDDDVDAIGIICTSVVSMTESKAIQQSINLLDFSDLGQRTRVRVFFSKMPPPRDESFIHFYHGTSLEQAKKLLTMELTPYEVPANMLLDWRKYTDFGKGFYTHPEEGKKLAVDRARDEYPEWGVVRLSLTSSELSGISGTPLQFQTKRNDRPGNSPVLFDGKAANWIEFVEYNRHIRSSTLRPDDYDWSPHYPWMRGPIWVRRDSGIPEGPPVFPENVQQINWGQSGLTALNIDTAKQRRFLFTKENEHLLGVAAGAGGF